MLKEDYSAEQINAYLNKFTPIYENGNIIHPIPDGVAITVYCDDGDEPGFIENTTHDELGIEELIAKRWILQNDLDSLIANATSLITNDK